MNQICNQSLLDASAKDSKFTEKYIQCPTHPKKQLILLKLSDEDVIDGQALKCLDCIYEQSYNTFFPYIPLDVLLKSDSQTIFKGWPIFDDSQIYQDLFKISMKPYSFYQEQIKTFFKQLKSQINYHIELKENQIIQNLNQNKDLTQLILDEYNLFSCKDQLKDILLNQNDDFSKQNQMLKDILKDNKINYAIKKAKIQNLINKTKKYDTILNTYNLQQQKLIKIIQNFDIFEPFQNSQNSQQISLRQQPQKCVDESFKRIQVNNLQDLRNCQDFQNIKIDFSQISLGVEESEQIANLLENCNSVQELSLNLSCSMIGDQGISLICNSLQKFTNITKLNLNLSSSQIKEQGIKSLSQAILQLQNITSLNLKLGNNLIEKEVKSLTDNLSKCQKITKLTLNLEKINNSFTVNAQIANNISDMLQKLTLVQNLTINLKGSRISSDGIQDLARILHNLKGLSYLNLDLRNLK
ncbi:hypothetical protein ABPG72_007820 [Tetrahymena utriculariae]